MSRVLCYYIHMFDLTVTERCHRILAEYIKEGDIAVDCTAGNGHDTLFLARAVGEAGRVYAFDVQKEAIENTSRLLTENGIDMSMVSLIQDSHANLDEYLQVDSPRPNIIMYNLGYMPGGDHTITTTETDTLKSLEIALDLVTPGGIITVIAYPGHAEGAREMRAIKTLLSSLPTAQFEVVTITQDNRKNAPVLFLISAHHDL